MQKSKKEDFRMEEELRAQKCKVRGDQRRSLPQDAGHQGRRGRPRPRSHRFLEAEFKLL